jgi:hypothetical protein
MRGRKNHVKEFWKKENVRLGGLKTVTARRRGKTGKARKNVLEASILRTFDFIQAFYEILCIYKHLQYLYTNI